MYNKYIDSIGHWNNQSIVPINSWKSNQVRDVVLSAGVSKCGARFEALWRGPVQWCVYIFEGVHQGAMIEISDATKARPAE